MAEPIPLISFAGVPLLTSTPEVEEWVANHFKLSDIFTFQHIYHPPDEVNPAYNLKVVCPELDQPVELGTLFWPYGCTRFCHGHFICTSSQLAAISVAVPPPAQGKLIMRWVDVDDAIQDWIEPPLYLLPPRPLSTVGDGRFQDLYLLTLVCPRYWHWWRPLVVGQIPGPGQGWADEMRIWGKKVGDPILTTPVSEGYVLGGNESFMMRGLGPFVGEQYFVHVGFRFVRKLNGEFWGRSREFSEGDLAANIGAARNKIAGGFVAEPDRRVPEKFIFKLPFTIKAKLKTPDGQIVDGPRILDGTSGAELTNDVTRRNNKRILEVPLNFDPFTPGAGEGAVEKVCRTYMTDWLKYNTLNSVDAKFAGIQRWNPEGFHDIKWTFRSTEVSTRIMPGPQPETNLKLREVVEKFHGDTVISYDNYELTENEYNLYVFSRRRTKYLFKPLKPVTFHGWEFPPDAAGNKQYEGQTFYTANIGDFPIIHKHGSSGSDAGSRGLGAGSFVDSDGNIVTIKGDAPNLEPQLETKPEDQFDLPNQQDIVQQPGEELLWQYYNQHWHYSGKRCCDLYFRIKFEGGKKNDFPIKVGKNILTPDGSDATLGGLQSEYEPGEGEKITLANDSETRSIYLAHEDPENTEANRFSTPDSQPVTIRPKQAVVVEKNKQLNRYTLDSYQPGQLPGGRPSTLYHGSAYVEKCRVNYGCDHTGDGTTEPYVGSGTITQADTTVTGTLTKFLSEVVVGDRITSGLINGKVTAVASDTSLTVDTSYTTTEDNPYVITPHTDTTTGSGTITQAGTTVTGTLTKFLSEVVVGDVISSGAIYGRVVRISTDTSLTLDTSTTVSTASVYTITSQQGVPGSGVLTQNGQTITGSGTKFTTEILPGDSLSGVGLAGTVQTVASDTELTVDTTGTSTVPVPFLITSPESRLLRRYSVERIQDKGRVGGYVPLTRKRLVAQNFLGRGNPTSTTFLRGDGLWIAPARQGDLLATPIFVDVSVSGNTTLTFLANGSAWNVVTGSTATLTLYDPTAVGNTSTFIGFRIAKTFSGVLTITTPTGVIIAKGTTYSSRFYSTGDVVVMYADSTDWVVIIEESAKMLRRLIARQVLLRG